MSPGLLSQVLRQFQGLTDDSLLVGLDPAGDAAVLQLNEQLALIHTVDFFTPVVDDPYIWGQIAAANSLSDVYAMGGQPLLALNIACFPSCLDVSVLGDVLRGGSDKAREAGVIIGGGHTVTDDEPKYGLAVVGTVHPQNLVTNARARPGDVLVLTKPLGTGIIISAVRGDIVDQRVQDMAVRSMVALNADAAEAMAAVGANACTDITGFGLVGHAVELAQASGVSLIIDSKSVPLLEGALDLAKLGIVPGGARRNRDYFGGDVDADAVDPVMVDMLYDPQTSGGLLVCLPAQRVDQFIGDREYVVIGTACERSRCAVSIQ